MNYVLVFSKNRPMQLQGTLESFFNHCEVRDDWRIRVLCCGNESKYLDAYSKVAELYRNVDFIIETSFKKDVIDTIKGSEYVMFVVDDTIFVSHFDLDDITKALYRSPAVIGFSLRLGTNTTECYPIRGKNYVDKMTSYAVYPRYKYFYWTKSEGDFGYPLEVSSSVYRTEDIFPILDGCEYKNPNELEFAMSLNIELFTKSKPFLMCNEISVAFSNPINKVNPYNKNRSGHRLEYTEQSLLDSFLVGYRIDVKKFDGFVPNGAHQEVYFDFYNTFNL